MDESSINLLNEHSRSHKKIGIMGGTFDPIHLGHLQTALEAAEQLGLDQVRFIPSAIPPHRAAPYFSAAMRCQLVALAIQNEPLFVLDDCELQREGTSYTADTLANIRQTLQLHPQDQLFFFLGTDAVLQFTRWHHWQRILANSHLIVLNRPDYLLAWGALEPYVVTTKKDLFAHSVGKIYPIDVTPLAISATMIRLRLREKRSIRYLVPQICFDFLQEQPDYS
ncbi:MAG: nicotinate-nucleotide adenylyltransferase [bacterium]